MATYAGFSASGILGAIVATAGLVAPSVMVIIMVAKLMDKYQCNSRVQAVLTGIRPAVLALILFAGLQIARLSLTDIAEGIVFVVLLAAIHWGKKSPIFYLCVSAIAGVVLKL